MFLILLLLGAAAGSSCEAVSTRCVSERTTMPYDASALMQKTSTVSLKTTRTKIVNAHGSATICFNAAVALNFEHHRLLHWIAYHNLLGVDCFLLHLDMTQSNLSNSEQRSVYNALHSTASPAVHIVEEVQEREPGSEPSRAVPRALLSSIRPSFFLTIDVDEFLVLDARSAISFSGGSYKDLAVPPSILEFLENTTRSHEPNDVSAIYLHRWNYGTSGYETQPSREQGMPEFFYLRQRDGNALRSHNNCSQQHMVRNGKVIQKVRGAQILGCGHSVASELQGHAIYPNGTYIPIGDFAAVDSEWLEGTPSPPVTSQPLFINHYITGSLEDCLLKLTAVHGKRTRTESECRAYHPNTTEYNLQHEQGMVNDPILAQYGAATRARVSEMFQV